MNMKSARKGSALLIVLGMLAFMVISAIGFSAYMRSSRLPSSYLRRSSLSRQLAKAALAEAIEQIDLAIGNNPHPGVGSQAPSMKRLSAIEPGATARNRNRWRNHIYIGDTGDNSYLGVDSTVSTLTLEGLAYIPPMLVNEARRYSRQSAGGKWHWLGFDAGRYAFTAIDVSNCLDVNRLKADSRRNAGARRITLAHLFENADHTGYELQPSAWDSFMEQFRDDKDEDEEAEDPGLVVEGKVPLVSVADLNLALNESGPSDFKSPFCEYVKGNNNNFYNVQSKQDPKVNKIRAMNFVTDSYFPELELDNGEVNLDSDEGQPFDNYNLTKLSPWEMTSPVGIYKNNLSGVDLCCLYDYLDKDNIPTSLAIPTTERVPMIAGIKHDLSLALKPMAMPLEEEGPDDNGYYTRTTEYKFDAGQFTRKLQLAEINATLLFPFKRGGDVLNKTFSADACFRIFFAKADDITSLRNIAGVAPTSDGDFSAVDFNNGVFRMAGNAGNVPNFSNVMSEDEAIKDVKFTFNNAGNLANQLNQPVFTVTERYQKSLGVETGKEIIAAHCNLPPLDPKTGNVLSDFADDNRFLEVVRNNSSPMINLYAAIFMRIKEGNKTVDMVPASFASDANFLGRGNNRFGSTFDEQVHGGQNPALRLNAPASFTGMKFDPQGFMATGEQDIQFGPKTLICPDPRYNHAPENWIKDQADWKNYVVDGNVLKQNGRDGDIFMFVSNREQLQSVYELAFLPRTCNLDRANGGGDPTFGNYKMQTVTDYPTSINECGHAALMWKTYNCFSKGGVAKDDFEGLGLVSGRKGYKISPYAVTANGIMPAFANTPYDWWAAATNVVGEGDIPASDLKTTTFNKKYAFNAMNDDARFAWEDLKAIATAFNNKTHTEITNNGGDLEEAWQNAYDSLEWDGEENRFCGVELTSGETDKLHDVDRKFLYGYWRDCFGARQQLFLIFVRAEPMMMGGGAVGQTPPQLGARAVALVWRDPRDPRTIPGANPKVDADTPHRTRILFYRQLD